MRGSLEHQGGGGLDYRALFERGGSRSLIVRGDAPRFSVLAISDAYVQLLEQARDALVGLPLAEVLAGSAGLGLDPDGVLTAALERVLATRAPDSTRIGPSGSPPSSGVSSEPPFRHWRVVHVPLFAADGELLQIVQWLEDETELVRLERHARDQERQNELLRQSVWPKSASDELRTPLALMLGPIQDILSGTRGVLPESVRVDIEVVQRNALRLHRFVNALLELSRGDSERAVAEYEPTDLASATAAIAAQFRPVIERAGLRLELDCEPLHPNVFVDPELWEKLVVELLSNAFKFTEEGAIRVSVRAQGAEVAVVVSDTGVGIDAANLPRVFERFFRAEGQKERGPEGTGVGLALVRQLTRLHGGDVQLESVERGGTAVRVLLPLGSAHLPQVRVVAADPASRRASVAAAYVEELSLWLDRAAERDAVASLEPLSSQSKRGRARILIAHDDAAMLGYLSRTLSTLWQVDVAVDGKSALGRARSELPDLVISDVMMPGLDGHGLLYELRKDARTRHVPVLLLSGRPEGRATFEGIERGADDYLVKPFSERDLLMRVQSHLNTSQLRRAWVRELEHSSRELQAFSYSVSHDLRAPLRTIDGFSQSLLEEHADALDDEGRRYLNRIRAAAQTMGSLIDDLLELSRVGRAALTRERVDLTELAEEALQGLAEREPVRAVYTFVVPGLWADGDRRLLGLVLDHLLGNAWKFTSKRALGRIEVGRERQDEGEVFFVRDNGVGFELSDAGRLFSPFQRLHAAEFEGRGIGLTMVQRIVTRHGGRLWVDASRDRGATFFFTLGEPE